MSTVQEARFDGGGTELAEYTFLCEKRMRIMN
jgi:hypothetical protein